MSTPASACILYCTTSSKAEAAAIAEAILARGLIACANILGPSTSLFRWKGKSRRAREYILLCKTTSERSSKAIEAIASLHSYDCPCILALGADHGHPPYLRWIRQCVRG